MQIKDSELDAKYVIGALVVSLVAFFMFTPDKVYQAGDSGGFAFGGLFAVSMVALIPLGIASYFKTRYQKITYITALAVLTVISILGQNGISLAAGHQNFEQCMIDGMRGQPQNMTPVVAKECRRKFPVN